MNNNLISAVNRTANKVKSVSILMLFFAVTLTVKTAPVDSNTAKLVGKNFLDANNSVLKLELVPIGSMKKNLISFQSGTTPFYIFNLENNGGWVIVAGDDAVMPILAYSKEGTWDTNNIAPGAAYMLDVYAASVADVQSNMPTNEEWNGLLNPTDKKSKNTFQASVAPLITTRWNQDNPYNYLCPFDAQANKKCVTGCVATAMAQIMNYHKCPPIGQGSHSYSHSTYGTLSANFGNTIYDFNNMLDVYSGNNYINAQRDAVATLMYHCGVAVNMDYEPNGSGAYTSTVVTALKTYFKYGNVSYLSKNSYNATAWETLLINELDNQRPIIYDGTNPNTNLGHAWILDGYDAQNRFHMNWGWSGYADGYFVLTSLTPNSDNYTASQNAVINIDPLISPTKTYTIKVEAGTGGKVAKIPNNTTNLVSGTSVTLTATANSGYKFSNWIRKGTNTVISSNNPYDFTVSSNDSLVANFTAMYTITVNASTGGTVSTNPSNTTNLISGTKVTLTATANNGYKFNNWTRKNTNTIINSNNPYTFNVNKNDSLVANFTAIYTITVNASTGGTVSTNPSNTTNLVSGTKVTLTATANNGYKFNNWTRKGTNTAINSNNPYTFSVTSNDSLVANFVIKEFTVQLGGVNPSNAGTVTGFGSYKLYDTAKLTAVADSGYKFSNWSSNNVIISSDNPLLLVVTNDTVITANFIEDKESIEEIIKLGTVTILPNPTNSDFTVSFDVIKPSNMKIILLDLTGKKMLDIYDGFTVDGIFTTTVKTDNLPKGVYFLKILIDGNYTVEKIILE